MSAVSLPLRGQPLIKQAHPTTIICDFWRKTTKLLQKQRYIWMKLTTVAAIASQAAALDSGEAFYVSNDRLTHRESKVIWVISSQFLHLIVKAFCAEDGFLAEGWEARVGNVLISETLWLNGKFCFPEKTHHLTLSGFLHFVVNELEWVQSEKRERCRGAH